MVNFGEAIKRPFSNKKTLLISFVIGLIPIINILMAGFAAHFAKNYFEGKKELPHWSTSNIANYLIKAFSITVIKIIYTLIGLIVLGFALGAAVTGVIANPTDTTALSSAIVGAGAIALVGLLLLLIGGLLAPMAIMSYLKTGKFKEAFSIGKILRKTLTVKYLVSLIVMGAYLTVLSIVLGLLTTVTLGLGALLSGGIFTYLFLVTAYEVMASTYNETP